MSIYPADRLLPDRFPAPPETPALGSPSVSTVLLGVDIAAFGDRRRDDDARVYLRRQLYETMAEALAMTGPPWRSCYKEDRGDGVLIVMPAHTPAALLMDPLAHHVHAVLRRTNRLASEAGRLRLRLAVHTGLVRRDTYGITGHASITLFRLLEAAAFKRLLGADTDVGLIVSDPLYHDVVRRGGLIDPEGYVPIRAHCKETRVRAWVWRPRPVPGGGPRAV